MGSVKSLAKDTVYYGLSTIVPRLLNWCLMPFYVNVLEPGAYGEVTNLFGYMALLLVILTYGMETGFFRFANDKSYHNAPAVYTTAQTSLLITSVLFIALIFVFLNPISSALSYPPDYIWMLGVIIAIDAFCSLPFAYLRYERRPLRFLSMKMLSVSINIGLNLFFLLLCPYLHRVAPQTISWFYLPDYGVGYIIVSNLFSSAVVLLAFIPSLLRQQYRFDPALLRRMLVYSFPILILGIAGIMNQAFDKIIFPLLADPASADEQLGVYGAGYKIAVVMVMFISAFRFAFEPFIFARSKDESDNQRGYIQSMHFFVILGMIIFLGVVFYIDLIKMIIPAAYYPGLRVVPIILMAEFFSGIFFNLSVWYKISDRTHWGAIFSVVGFVITLGGNLFFIGQYGYMACAWTAFACYFVMMLLSYIIGCRYYPIKYKWVSGLKYVLLALALYGVSQSLSFEHLAIRLFVNTILFAAFIVYTIKTDLPLSEIPYLNRWINSKKNGDDFKNL